MTETVKQAIGGVAFILNVWGNLELTKQTNRGHIIRLCSNACWLIYSPLVGAWALFLNHAAFAAINMLGFYRWRQIEERRAPEVSGQNQALTAANTIIGQQADEMKALQDRLDEVLEAVWSYTELDVEHMISCHADSLPEAYRRACAALDGAKAAGTPDLEKQTSVERLERQT